MAEFAAEQTPAIVQIRPKSAGEQSDLQVPWRTWTQQVHDVASTVSTGAGLWLSVPAVAGLNHVGEATGLPIVVRDTDVPIRPAAWQGFFQSPLPLTVRGMIMGTSGLFPLEGSVADALSLIHI